MTKANWPEIVNQLTSSEPFKMIANTLFGSTFEPKIGASLSHLGFVDKDVKNSPNNSELNQFVVANLKSQKIRIPEPKENKNDHPELALPSAANCKEAIGLTQAYIEKNVKLTDCEKYPTYKYSFSCKFPDTYAVSVNTQKVTGKEDVVWVLSCKKQDDKCNFKPVFNVDGISVNYFEFDPPKENKEKLVKTVHDEQLVVFCEDSIF